MAHFISENKMVGQVKFLNDISENDLAGLYQLASLSVYISFFEGFGLPVIESMASGCPVITSNVSCLPETAGGAAVLCTPNDVDELGKQIKLILEKETLRNELIAKGKEWAKHFHPEQFSKKMISLYNEILF
jgi:glycosyltransferase involved in cell wall biosynthesis